MEEIGFSVKYRSDKKSKVIRLFDMIKGVHTNRKWVSVVIIDTYSTTNFYYAILVGVICKILNIKYIPILHGGSLPDRFERSKLIFNKFLSDANRIVSPSRYMRIFFESKGYKIKFIPNSIKIQEYLFSQRNNLKPKIYWVRAFDSIYNPGLAIEAVKKLRKRIPEIDLCMVGPDKDGSLRKCEELVENNNLSENVTFTGRLTKNEWIERSLNYSIFINTTNYDNMPLTLIEAMALGFPIISTNVGGIPYLLENGKNALLVPPNDPSIFADTIESLLNDKQKASELSRNARKAVEDHYDWEIVKHKWKELLDSNEPSIS